LTICLAIKCEKKRFPCVLFGADTQESSMLLKSSTTKLRLIEGKEPAQGKKWVMAVASSGDAAVINEAIDEISYFMYENIGAGEEKPSMALLTNRAQIGDIAYATYKKYKERGIENAEFELLFVAADEFSTILRITCEGKNEVLEKFGIIGSGRITGGELLLREFLKADITQTEAARLAALVISIVGHVDMFVGGEPDMFICRNRKVWVYKEDTYREILKESESRWALMKNVWMKMEEDDSFEKRLRGLLSR